MRCVAFGVALAHALMAASPLRAEEPVDAQYAERVQPILEKHCYECHSHASKEAEGGLMVDTVGAIFAGGESGPAVVAGDVEASRLLRAVKYVDESLQMPPTGKLSGEEVAVLEAWVRQVQLPAVVLESGASKPPIAAPFAALQKRGKTHWAFQPLRAPNAAGDAEGHSLPALDGARGGVRRADSVSQSIDTQLALARARRGIAAVDLADRRSLVRRLYVDLWGLLPTPEQSAEFIDDASPEAWPRLVDRLLAAPEFGERWGRHWLDVARYADSNGCSIESNNTLDDAWRYRDYVIDAFFHDKPFNEFVREQVAGDLLPTVSDSERAAKLIATGFLLLGPKAFGTSDYDTFLLDVIDEQIDAVGKAFLGLALGCARCHDHKADPVSIRDYYALAGVFKSTASVRTEKGWRNGRTWNRVPLPGLDRRIVEQLQQAHAARRADVEAGKLKEAAALAEKQAEAELEKCKAAQAPAEEIVAAERALQQARRERRNADRMAKVFPIISPVPTVMAVADEAHIQHEHIRLRGVAKAVGDVVPRGVPALWPTTERFAVSEHESGRLQLASWLVDVEHGAGALTARVAVNRMWNHLMGRPLVASVDNLGLSGSAPEHPELLEILAASFVDQGWSVKRMIRSIVLSESYRRGDYANAQSAASDPDNATYWHHAARRLDAETLRDSVLQISGALDRTRGGKTLQHLGLLTISEDCIDLDAPDPYQRRTIYLPILRDAVDIDAGSDEALDMLATFDFADPNLMRGARDVTTVPGQPLFLLNSEFMHRHASRLATNLLAAEEDAANEERVRRLWLLAYNRLPDAEETAAALAHIVEVGAVAAGATPQPGDSGQPGPAVKPIPAGWISLCQSVFGSVEFLFVP